MHIRKSAIDSASLRTKASVDESVYLTSTLPVSQESLALTRSERKTSFMHLLVHYLCLSATFIAFFQTPWCTVTLEGAKPSDEYVFPDLYEASVTELQEGLNGGHFSSVDLVKAYITRIDEVNIRGPRLRAVIEVNPSALAQAAELDAERKRHGPRGPLHGIPILLKDNIATIPSEGMNTTAGSYALLGSIVPRDAGVVKKLRKAGAIILGKANLSEWAHARGHIASGWSGRGGQGTNPYYPNADPCGSSSGSAVAAAIGLAAVTLGTETGGSITCPSAYNNVVGIKPTVGLTSRAGVIPISRNQDTVGPITRSMVDAAIVLSIIAGKDKNDNFTLAQPDRIPNYMAALKTNGLVGKRIGVPRKRSADAANRLPDIDAAFEEALVTLKALGATIIDPADLPDVEELLVSQNETVVLNIDIKEDLNSYFAGLKENPSGVQTLADLIQYDIDHADLELPPGYEDQFQFLISEGTAGYNSSYFESLKADHDLGRTRGIDAVLEKYQLDALVSPVTPSAYTTTAAAIAGYPIITVPLGFFSDNVTLGHTYPQTLYPAPGVPFGLSFLGTAYSEFDLISIGYAFEQKTQVRLEKRAYRAAIPKTQLKDVVGIR